MTDVRLSFNEVEALSAKAARGAGLGWGHAEDLGRAARWLAAHGFDWPRPLLRLLDGADANGRAAGLTLAADRAGRAKAGDAWRIDATIPALLTPMLSTSLHGHDVDLVLRCDQATLTLHPDGSARLHGEPHALDRDGPVTIEAIRPDPPAPGQPLPSAPRPPPLPAAVLARLSAYADRTAVPASDASRARGAGSGLSDND